MLKAKVNSRVGLADLLGRKDLGHVHLQQRRRMSLYAGGQKVVLTAV